MDLAIANVTVDGCAVEVTTGAGGRGRAEASLGFTSHEARLMARLAGTRCLAPQTLACMAFGRIYGQGAGMQASVFSLACARALMDTVRLCWPGKTVAAAEDLPGCCGAFLGGAVRIGGISASWLLTINAAINGSGPNEDAEGCVPVGNKAALMEQLGMMAMPLIVLEGKAFIPSQSPRQTSILVRWNSEYDNTVVAECAIQAAQELKLPLLALGDAYPRQTDALAEATRTLGEEIADIGIRYSVAATASQKAELLARLCALCSHDAGASVFMSNAVHRYVGNGGLWPGLGAMLSLAATEDEVRRETILCLSDEEIENVVRVMVRAAQLLSARRDEACALVRERRPDIGPARLRELALGR